MQNFSFAGIASMSPTGIYLISRRAKAIFKGFAPWLPSSFSSAGKQGDVTH